MPANYDHIDLRWVGCGDYVISDEGDLQDTLSDGLLSLIQEIQDICKCELGDWEMWPAKGVTPEDFVGEPNNEETAISLHDRIRIAIVTQGLVSEQDLSIKIIPVHRYEVLVVIRVRALATPYNQLGKDQLLTVNFIFNYDEKGVFFLQEPPSLLVNPSR